MTKVLVLALALASIAPAARAADITVTSPWLRATPKHAAVAGGYATITNTGATADRLLGASLPIAPEGQVHSMSMADGMMHMEHMAKGLAIPPGKTVALTPGGYHLMFIKPQKPLSEGDRIEGTLTFEKAGTIAVTFPVAAIGAKQAPSKAPK